MSGPRKPVVWRWPRTEERYGREFSGGWAYEEDYDSIPTWVKYNGDDIEPLYAASGDTKQDANSPTHEDLCRLSRIFNDTDHVLPHGARFRINEWLKVQIAAVDDIAGMAWWNALTEQERAAWAMAAGNTGRAKDAWEAFKRATITPYLDNGVSP